MVNDVQTQTYGQSFQKQHAPCACYVALPKSWDIDAWLLINLCLTPTLYPQYEHSSKTVLSSVVVSNPSGPITVMVSSKGFKPPTVNIQRVS